MIFFLFPFIYLFIFFYETSHASKWRTLRTNTGCQDANWLGRNQLQRWLESDFIFSQWKFDGAKRQVPCFFLNICFFMRWGETSSRRWCFLWHTVAAACTCDYSPPHNLLMLGLFKMNGKLISVFSSSCSKNSFYLKIKIKNKIHIHKKTVKRVKVVITSTSWFIAGVGFVPKSKKTVQLFFV